MRGRRSRLNGVLSRTHGTPICVSDIRGKDIARMRSKTVKCPKCGHMVRKEALADHWIFAGHINRPYQAVRILEDDPRIRIDDPAKGK